MKIIKEDIPPQAQRHVLRASDMLRDIADAIEKDREDAERYRWLRKAAESYQWTILEHKVTSTLDRAHFIGSELDLAIDAGRKFNP